MIKFSPKKILVTGGMGFIGSNFIKYLIKNNDIIKIVNLDSCTYAASVYNLKNLVDPTRHILVKGDINDRQLVNALLEEYCIDAIVHFAAESHVDQSIIIPGKFIETNIVGTFSLLEEARSVWQHRNKWTSKECRFYHISTDEVYGSCETVDTPSFSEQSPYKPCSPYAASKAASNHIVSSYFHTYGLPVVISNCTNNFGPNQHLEKFIPKIIDSCIQGKPIPIYGNGSNIRDWLYVEDHCVAINMVLSYGEIGNEYNIAGGNECSNIKMANLICSLMDEYLDRDSPHKQLISFVQDRPGHDWRYSLNCEKISQLLQWQPKIAFEDALRRTVQFYLELNKLKLTARTEV